MADITYKGTVFLRLTYDADKVPKVAALRDCIQKIMEEWCAKECDEWKCSEHTTKVETT